MVDGRVVALVGEVLNLARVRLWMVLRLVVEVEVDEVGKLVESSVDLALKLIDWSSVLPSTNGRLRAAILSRSRMIILLGPFGVFSTKGSATGAQVMELNLRSQQSLPQ